MPALEPVTGLRVVAAPSALDGARWGGDDVDVLRIAADEAFAIGATRVDLDDPDAIVEPEAGFSVAILDDLLDQDDLVDVAAHTEWPIPASASPRVAQGKIAGVPAKLIVGTPSILVVQTAYADELRNRRGW